VAHDGPGKQVSNHPGCSPACLRTPPNQSGTLGRAWNRTKGGTEPPHRAVPAQCARVGAGPHDRCAACGPRGALDRPGTLRTSKRPQGRVFSTRGSTARLEADSCPRVPRTPLPGALGSRAENRLQLQLQLQPRGRCCGGWPTLSGTGLLSSRPARGSSPVPGSPSPPRYATCSHGGRGMWPLSIAGWLPVLLGSLRPGACPRCPRCTGRSSGMAGASSRCASLPLPRCRGGGAVIRVAPGHDRTLCIYS
jgi:hypothetical protein